MRVTSGRLVPHDKICKRVKAVKWLLPLDLQVKALIEMAVDESIISAMALQYRLEDEEVSQAGCFFNHHTSITIEPESTGLRAYLATQICASSPDRQGSFCIELGLLGHHNPCCHLLLANCSDIETRSMLERR